MLPQRGMQCRVVFGDTLCTTNRQKCRIYARMQAFAEF